MEISRFIVKRCSECSLFQGAFLDQESDRLFRDLVGEFDSGMGILHKVDEIQRLVVVQ